MQATQPFLGNHCITKPGNLLFHTAHLPCTSLGALGAMQGLQGSQRLFRFELAQFVTDGGTCPGVGLMLTILGGELI